MGEMTDTIKPSEGDAALFLRFVDDLRAYHQTRVKDFDPKDELMQAIYKGSIAALDTMTHLIADGHHPNNICLALSAASANTFGRLAVHYADTAMPLTFMSSVLSEMNNGIAKQKELEEASGRPS